MRLTLAAALMMVAVWALTTDAAGHVTGRTPTARLSTPEHRAIALESLGALDDQATGLIVTAAFRGDIEQRLGQGGLQHAVVALVLVPRAPAASRTGLLDTGGGFVLARVPIPKRSGNRTAVSLQTVAMFGREQVLHVRTPAQDSVIRAGDQLIFHLSGAAAGQLAALKLEVFSTSPPGSARLPSAAAWRSFLSARPLEAATVTLGEASADCTRLAASRTALSADATVRLEPELRRAQQARGQLRTALGAYPALAHLGIAKSTLAGELSLTRLGLDRLETEITGLRFLVGRLSTALKACAPPPPQPPSPPSAPAPTTTTTTTTTTSPPPPPPSVQVVQTDSSLSQNMAPQTALSMSTTAPQGVRDMIDVNEQLRYQQFNGLGAAMTDSSAYVINGMPSSQRAALIQDLFGQPNSGSGLAAPPIHLNFLRVGIGATGAMTVSGAYSYDDNPPGGTDPNLDYFSIAHDTAYIIPTLQQVLQTNPDLEILANPWSPPAWMKSNDSLGNNNASGNLLAQYYQTYANYFVKFIQAYTQAGIPIDAITPANEPTSGSGGTGYPGLNFPESDEAQFIADDLAPALSQAGLNPKIYGNDLSWDQYSGYANPLAGSAAAPDLTGISWHCYFNSPTVMSQLQQSYPSLDQIVDECSPEIRSVGTPEFLISTLRNWASVVAVWSVALEPNGQPIQTPNDCGGCRGLVSVDPTTGAVTYRTEYYQFGQVSAFVQPGAWRIDSPNFVTYGTNSSNNWESVTSGLDDVAFLNPDGSKVLVAYNNSSAPISFGVESDGSYFTYDIPAQAMTTFVWP